MAKLKGASCPLFFVRVLKSDHRIAKAKKLLNIQTFYQSMTEMDLN